MTFVEWRSFGQEKPENRLALAPWLLAEIAQRIMPEQEELIGQLGEAISLLEPIATEDRKKEQIQLAWLKTVLGFETEQTPFSQRLTGIYEFCRQFGFIDEKGELNDPIGQGGEFFDYPFASDFGFLPQQASLHYGLVKASLAPLNRRRLAALLQKGKMEEEKFLQAESLLLKDYRTIMEKLARHGKRKNEPAFAFELGPDKCENAALWLRAGITPILMDIQPLAHIKDKFQQAMKHFCPDLREIEIVELTNNAQTNSQTIQEKLSLYDGKQRVFIISQNIESGIPLPDNFVDAAGCIYVRHHLSEEGQRTMLREMIRISRPIAENEKAVFVVDADRRKEPFLQMTLPVMAKLRLWFTGLDAIITHCRGWFPSEALNLGRQTNKEITWQSGNLSKDVITPFGPLIYSQLVYLAGFNPQSFS